jgi:hypothetical protein
VCQQTYYILSRLINASLSDGETGSPEPSPVAIDGGLVERIEFVSPWKMVIVLRNGKRIAVEPDFYNEIRLCNPERDGDDCYLENTHLRVYEDGGEEG